MACKVNIYILETSKFEQLSYFKQYLKNMNLNISKQMFNKKKEKEFILSRYLLALALNKEFSIEKIDLLKSEYGKPYILNGPRFNISHCENYVAVAVSKVLDLGLDVELTTRSTAYPKIVEKYFHEFESKYIYSKKNTEFQQNTFLQLWTLKEAVFKCFGLQFNKENAKIYFEYEKSKIMILAKRLNNNSITAFLYNYKNLYLSLAIAKDESVDTRVNLVSVDHLNKLTISKITRDLCLLNQFSV